MVAALIDRHHIDRLCQDVEVLAEAQAVEEVVRSRLGHSPSHVKEIKRVMP